MLASPELHSWHRYSFAGSITLVFASDVGLYLGQPQWRGERRFKRPRRGTDDQGRPLARETVQQPDDFASRVKAKREELAPCKLSPRAERLNDGRLPDGEVVAGNPACGSIRNWPRIPSPRMNLASPRE